MGPLTLQPWPELLVWGCSQEHRRLRKIRCSSRSFLCHRNKVLACCLIIEGGNHQENFEILKISCRKKPIFLKSNAYMIEIKVSSSRVHLYFRRLDLVWHHDVVTNLLLILSVMLIFNSLLCILPQMLILKYNTYLPNQNLFYAGLFCPVCV